MDENLVVGEKLTRKNYLYIFLFHGFVIATLLIIATELSWDALISIGTYMLDAENAVTNGDLYGGIILGVTLLLGMIYTITTFVITIKTARKAKRENVNKETIDVE